MIRSIAERLAWTGVPDLRTSLIDRLAHAALVAQGAEQWTQVIAGHRVQRYAVQGSGTGPAVLLIHGLNGSSSSMASLVRGLTGVSRRITLFDLPGHGRSPERPTGALSVAEHAAIVLALVDDHARETEEPALPATGGARRAQHPAAGKIVLVGNSLGGALALYAASARPDQIAGVVGLNPAGAEVANAAVGNLPRSFPNAHAGARHIAGLLFEKTPMLFWLIGRDVARGWERETVQHVLADVRAGNHKKLTQAQLEDLRVPVYILWGEGDRMLPAASVDEFRRIPGARIELIPHCGHMPQLERPKLTSKRVAEFIASL